MMAPRPGRPEAAAAIWSWQRPATPPQVSPRRQRVKGGIQAGLALLVGLLLYLLGSKIVAFCVFGFASLILLAALLSPTGLHVAIQRMFEALGAALGRALTFVLMSSLFYVFFLPFGKLLRGGRRDRLKRAFDADAPTYWEARPQSAWDAGRLDRQY